MSSTINSNVSLKLLIETKGQRVVYAEAGKDFVDFLFDIPLLPLGTVIRLLSKQGVVGCLGNLYSSIENFSDSRKWPSQKDNILKPLHLNCGTTGQVLSPDIKASTSNTFYSCNECWNLMAYDQDYMDQQIGFVDQPKFVKERGYVKGVTYMITDDLEVKPMSTFSSLILLKKYCGVLEEKVVNLGKDEGLKLLKASLHSKTVLSDVFLVINTEGSYRSPAIELGKRKAGTGP